METGLVKNREIKMNSLGDMQDFQFHLYASECSANTIFFMGMKLCPSVPTFLLFFIIINTWLLSFSRIHLIYVYSYIIILY